MSASPRTLQALGSYWVSQGGVNLGVVGNFLHCKGYHLGRDRIYGPCACKPRGKCVPGEGRDDYSVRTARDRAGLSYAASAIDLGKLNGSLKQLQAFSVWLVDQARSNKPGTADLREVIYTPDGVNVWRWDRERGYWSSPRAGEADDSHLSHTHISYYRDSEDRNKVALFARYFADPPPTTTEGDVKFLIPDGTPTLGEATTTRDTRLYRWDGARIPLDKGATRAVYGFAKVDGNLVYTIRTGGEQEGHYLIRSHARYVKAPGDVKRAVVLKVEGQPDYRTEV